MTKQELLEKLAEYARSGDEEVAHLKADEALLDYIDDREIKDAFNKIDKWYA